MQDSVVTRFFRLLPEATDEDLAAMRSVIGTLIRRVKKGDAVDLPKLEHDSARDLDRK